MKAVAEDRVIARYVRDTVPAVPPHADLMEIGHALLFAAFREIFITDDED